MDVMDTNSNLGTPILADSALMNNSSLGIHTALLPYSPNSATFNSSLLLQIPKMIPGILDDVMSSGWLDAMKSSSPTHIKLTKNVGSDSTSTDENLAYNNWLLKYPSAFSSFEKITNLSKSKKLALFLDYDGTLSPIVDNPDRAFMSSAMRAAVRNVARYFPTAIISGRSRDKVYEFVGLTELYYAGSHGMDIMGPFRPICNEHKNSIMSIDEQGKEFSLFQPATQFLPMINEVFRSLVKNTKEIDGTKVENNKFCVSVHYRNVEEKSWTIVAESVKEVLKHYPHLRLTHGRKVLEVRPMLAWDKGKAVQFLLESLGLSDSDDVLPIYIGDDRTDEDAFKFLREMNRGFGILVSSAPKDSNALYSLRDPSEVMEFLKTLALWKKNITPPHLLDHTKRVQ